MKLYHYTCCDSAAHIDRCGLLLPNYHPALGVSLLWLTDMARPDGTALGLTSALLGCDRTAVRYTCHAAAWWWPAYAADLLEVDAELRDTLELYGAPHRWWVATRPVPVRTRREVAHARR